MTPDELDAARLLPAQRVVSSAFVASPLVEDFYLTGGTDLAAFWLHHRRSEDLDFFSDVDVPLPAVDAFVRAIPDTRVVSFQRLYDRRIFLLDIAGEPLKVEFTRYPFPRSAPLHRLACGLALDPPGEVFVNKLAAMADRAEPKDEVDVFFLLRVLPQLGLAKGVAAAERKFGLIGLRHILQRRLLAVSAALPPTTPAVSRDEIAGMFRTEVEAMVAREDVDEDP